MLPAQHCGVVPLTAHERKVAQMHAEEQATQVRNVRDHVTQREHRARQRVRAEERAEQAQRQQEQAAREWVRDFLSYADGGA